jgi:hypothetical protein
MIVIQYKDGLDADIQLQECERKVNAIKEDCQKAAKIQVYEVRHEHVPHHEHCHQCQYT